LAILPDGTNLVYVANRQLYVRRLDEMTSHAIPGTDLDVGSPTFSPDGRSVAFFSFQDNSIKKIAINGGAAFTLCTGCAPTLGYGVSWFGDTILYSLSGQSIMSVPQSGGSPERLAKAEANEALMTPQLLPGGEVLMFTATKTVETKPAQQNGGVVVLSKKTGKRQLIIPGGSDARYLPSGKLLYYLNATLYVVPFDAAELKTAGDPVPVVEKVLKTGADYGTANFAVSENGTLVYVPSSSSLSADSKRVISVVDRNGKASDIPGLGPGGYTNPRISPDGSRIAVEVLDDSSISIYDISGKSQLRRLTFDATNAYPVWSPDGKRIAYRSNRQGEFSIFVQNADGTDSAEKVTTGPAGGEIPFSWGRNGRLIFLRDRRLATINMSGDRQIEPLSSDASITEYNAFFRPPDGSWIANTSYVPPQIGPRVFVQQFPKGPKYQVTRESSDAPAWSPDGKELFYYQPDKSKLMSVRIQTEPSFSAAEPVPMPIDLVQLPGSPRQYDVMPDGRFLVLRPAQQTATSGTPTQEIHVVLNWFEDLRQRMARQ
jgi:Tol biopolymer transport system component